MQKIRRGKIDISELNAPPEKHEYETAKYFADRGFDVKFIKPSNIKGTNSPDFKMIGKIWETKSPTGSSRRTFDDNFRKAVKQSENIIFDLRRLKIKSEMICLNLLKKKTISPKLKCLLVITRDGRLLTLKGGFDILEVWVA